MSGGQEADPKGDCTGEVVTQSEQDPELESIRHEDRYEKIGEMARASGKGNQRDVGTKVKFEWKVTLPSKHGDAEKSPLLVVLHEKDGNMRKTTDAWKAAADQAGAVLLVPQGTLRINRNKFQWGRDREAIANNVNEAIEKVVAENGCDKHRIIVAGFAEGASLAWDVALRNAETFRGVIPVCGRFDVKSESVFEDADAAKLRVYVLCGEKDDTSFIQSNKDAVKKLEKKGAKAKVKVLEEMGHAYPDSSDELVTALKFVLGE